jgi:hypothetical protein
MDSSDADGSCESNAPLTPPILAKTSEEREVYPTKKPVLFSTEGRREY